MNDEHGLQALGTTGAKFQGLETFAAPDEVTCVKLCSDEVTSLCPVTNQPDWYTVTVEYKPRERCVESKTFKLYIQSFRDRGLFCERFAQQVLEDLCAALDPWAIKVQVTQKPRGGVAIEATAARS